METSRRAQLVTRAVKTHTLARLAGEHARLDLQVQQQTNQAVITVWESGQRVHQELVATGAKTPQCVAQNLPEVPQPSRPTDPS